MINFDDVIRENIKEHNANWLDIPDYLYKLLIAGGSGSGKKNALLNLINHEPGIDKIFLYAKDSYEGKYQFFNINFLINKQKSEGLKHFNGSKAFIQYWNNMNNIYKNI